MFVGQLTKQILGNDTFFKIDASGATGVGKMMVNYRRNDTGSPFAPGWEVGSYFDSQGSLRLNGALTISGNIGPAATDGIFTINPPVNEGAWPAMVYVWSDVPYGIINRCGLSGVNNASYVSMNDTGSFTMAVMNAPRIRLGISASPLTLDSYIERSANLTLHTNARWDVDGGGSYGGRVDFGAGFTTLTMQDGNLNIRQSWLSDTGPTTYTAPVAASGTSVGHILRSATRWATPGDKIVSIRSNTTERNSFDYLGRLGSIALQAPPTITGSRGGNAAVASLLTALANAGVIVDSTTA